MAKATVVGLNGLAAAELVGLAKAGGGAKATLPVGDHDFDVTLRIQGTLRRGEDYSSTPTRSVPFKAVVALLVQRMGFQRDKAMEIFVQAMKDSLTEGVKVDLGDVDKGIALLNEALGDLPKVTSQGATTLVGDLMVTKVEQPVNA